jgi:hypothetical protein
MPFALIIMFGLIVGFRLGCDYFEAPEPTPASAPAATDIACETTTTIEAAAIRIIKEHTRHD